MFTEAAVHRQVDETIIEKDFWVCWVLSKIFALSHDHPAFVFKGGTSLSKAYELIKRFSEDIDIVTSIAYYLERGFTDPELATSKTKRAAAIEALDQACAVYVRGSLLPTLREVFANALDTTTGWELYVDDKDPFRHSLLFRYPATIEDSSQSYIRRFVKIELGWRSADEPVQIRSIQPYIIDNFPTSIENARTECKVLMPERTFWEKVTALHAANHQDTFHPFFSRHYSDVATMLSTDIGQNAARDLEMLSAGRDFKTRYYPAAWARYDLAVPGSLVIVPDQAKLTALRSDYASMNIMFFW